MTNSTQKSRFQIDFDEWSEMARHSPGDFERRRSRLLQEFIEDAPAHRQARLRGLQWQIDQIRATSGTPMAACLRISNMMWESVVGDDGLIARMEVLRGTRRLPGQHRSAKILPFRSRKAH